MNRRARSKSKQPEETRRTLVAADVAGVLLIAGGLFTALALWRDSGLVLGWYGQEVRLLFGTGAPLFALALILAGWFLFAQPNDRPIDIQVWQRLLGGEMLLVLLLALWHGIRATNPLQTDDLPAGVIGWLVFSAPATLIG
ncbi:hypothetical protein, partial [Ardenticatena maritima]